MELPFLPAKTLKITIPAVGACAGLPALPVATYDVEIPAARGLTAEEIPSPRHAASEFDRLERIKKCRTPEGSASDDEFVNAIERLFIAICKRSGIGSTTNDVTVARLADFEEAMNAKFARFESELRAEVKTLKTEMEGLRSEFAGIKALLNEVNLKIASAAGENKNSP